MTRLKILMTLTAATFFAGIVTAVAVPQTSGSESGRATARAYLAGMESSDFEALDRLFLADDRSSILENASDEGSWEHYRDHHLKPEMKAATNFKFTIANESEERLGDAIVVQQIGTFTVDVQGETRSYRSAVSYVMVIQDGRPRIAHLHWSSRLKE